MPVEVGPRVSWIPAILIALLGGCGATDFSEADRGRTETVDVGARFSIRLPSSLDWAPPALKGNCVRFLSGERVESMGRAIFRFKADKEGESEILIRARPAWGEDRDFSMRVRVVEGEGATAGEGDDDDPWSESWGRYRHGRDD